MPDLGTISCEYLELFENIDLGPATGRMVPAGSDVSTVTVLAHMLTPDSRKYPLGPIRFYQQITNSPTGVQIREIRGLAQDFDTNGISRKIFAIDTVTRRIVAEATSAPSTGEFVLRIPTSARVELYMRSLDADVRNDVVLSRVLPAEPL